MPDTDLLLIAQYEAVRRIGRTNMFDRPNVWGEAINSRYDELANVAQATQTYALLLGDYSRLIEKYELDKLGTDQVISIAEGQPMEKVIDEGSRR